MAIKATPARSTNDDPAAWSSLKSFGRDWTSWISFM
jgi:hypothetical protein